MHANTTQASVLKAESKTVPHSTTVTSKGTQV